MPLRSEDVWAANVRDASESRAFRGRAHGSGGGYLLRRNGCGPLFPLRAPPAATDRAARTGRGFVAEHSSERNVTNTPPRLWSIRTRSIRARVQRTTAERSKLES
eukprot:7201100-Prymnesium_polylepis.3